MHTLVSRPSHAQLMCSSFLGYPVQPPPWAQGWQSTVDSSAQMSHNVSQAWREQQYHLMPGTNPVLNQTGFEEDGSYFYY